MTTPTTRNIDRFAERLTEEYTRLFKEDPDYAYSASRTTPAELARHMTLASSRGNANKDGEGIKRTCKHFGLRHTHKAIRAFFDADYADTTKTNTTAV